MARKMQAENKPTDDANPEIDNTVVTKDDAAYIKRRKVVAIASIIVFFVLMIVIYIYVGKPLLATLENPENFRDWVSGKGAWSWLVMIGIMALQVIVAIIPGEPMEVGAGYAFGAWDGLILCLIGAFIGQLIIFVFVRKFGIKLVEVFVSREKMQSVKFFQESNSNKLDLLTFILYLIPGTPKDVLSYVAGLTSINMWRFLGLTTIARIPSVITSTVVGGALGDGKTKTAIIVFVLTTVVSAIGVLAYRIYSNNKSANNKATQNTDKETTKEESKDEE